MRYGLIGPGRHGSRYLLPENGGAEIDLVLRREPIEIPGHEITLDLDDFLESVDAAIIATGPESHRDLALACLTARIPILIEKPLALDWDACEEIIAMGEGVGVAVGVAHTHLFHPRFEDMVIADLDGEIPVTRVTSVSGGPGPVRSYSALLDWGPHDVAMAIAAFKEAPTAHRIERLSEGTYSIQLEFPTGEADLVISNRFPARVRTFDLEQRYSHKVDRFQYRGDEPSPSTPMARMVAVFRAVAEEGLTDYRFDPTFLRSVYDVLVPETEPKAKGH